MWLFMSDMTPVTLYVRLAPRPNESFKIASGGAAAPGSSDFGSGV